MHLELKAIKIESHNAVYDGDVTVSGAYWMAHGYGTGRFQDGTTYVGGHCWNVYHGYGKLIISPNEYMGGSFVNGKLNGQGHHFENCILFMGNFHDGIPNGYGTFYYRNRTSWTGIVENGHPVILAKKTNKKLVVLSLFLNISKCNIKVKDVEPIEID